MKRLTSLQRRYTFSFALILTAVLVVTDIVRQGGNFGWTDQLGNIAPLAIAAMASAPSIMSGGGGLDVSISPLMTFAGAMFIVVLVPHGLGGIVALPILLIICTGVGAVNGFLVNALRVPPVVVTLGMYFVLLGVDAAMLPDPGTVSASWVQHLAGTVWIIPGGLFTLGVPLLLWLGLNRLPYGHLLSAVGSNDAAAYGAGVNIAAVRIGAYAFGGLLAGIGGLALIALTSSADANQASSYTLIAIGGVALGGTSLSGGRGGLVGPLLGGASIYVLQDLLATFQVSGSWAEVLYGGALILAVVLSGIASRRRVEG